MDQAKVQLDIERRIIAGVVGEDQYDRVSFLEVDDFTDTRYQQMWKTITAAKGDYTIVLKSGNAEIMAMQSLADYTSLERLGLLLVESRYRRLLDRLTAGLLEASTDELEIGLLLKFQEESKNLDILAVIDGAPEYLELHCSKYVVDRFKAFRSYVDIRAEKIKKCL